MFNIRDLFLTAFAVLLAVNDSSFGMKELHKKNKANLIVVVQGNKVKQYNADEQLHVDRIKSFVALNNPYDLDYLLCKKADKDTLVVLDCDKVLLTKDGIDLKCMDEQILETVGKLQRRGIKVLVLSAVSDVDERVRQLKSNGFHFEDSWMGVEEFVLMTHEIKDVKTNKTRHAVVRFKEGVIVSDIVSKGLVINKFLNYLAAEYQRTRFSNVIFVDDLLTNVIDVKNQVKPADKDYFCLTILYEQKEGRGQTRIIGAHDPTNDKTILVKPKDDSLKLDSDDMPYNFYPTDDEDKDGDQWLLYYGAI